MTDAAVDSAADRRRAAPPATRRAQRPRTLRGRYNPRGRQQKPRGGGGAAVRRLWNVERATHNCRTAHHTLYRTATRRRRRGPAWRPARPRIMSTACAACPARRPARRAPESINAAIAGSGSSGTMALHPLALYAFVDTRVRARHPQASAAHSFPASRWR